MDSHIEAIRTAMQPEAAEAAKQEGIRACRAILALLEAVPATDPKSAGAAASPSPESTPRQPGGPSVNPSAGAAAPGPAPHQPASGPSLNPSTGAAAPYPEAAPQPGGPSLNPAALPEIATLLQGLRGMPAEQLLDLAIARLRAALPPGSTVPATSPVRFQLIPIHHVRGAK